MTVTCVGCGEQFEAQRKTAKWCSDRCRMAARRKPPKAIEPESAVDAAGDGSDHKPTAETEYGRDVLAAVRADLVKAKRLETVEGRVALYLARKSIDPDCKNPAAMFKEMRAALAIALAGAEAAGSEPEPEPEPEDDEVTLARKAREEARKAAGLA